MKINFIQNIIDILRGKKRLSATLFESRLQKDYQRFFGNTEISFAQIKNFMDLFVRSGCEFLRLDKGGMVFKKNDICFIVDPYYPWIAKEIFVDEIYKLESTLDANKTYTVFDLGANRCYASLYFAQNNRVNSVYAFEMVPQTIELVKENINLNSSLFQDVHKIHLYEFGLGKTSSTISIQRLSHRDGCNTINPDFIESYMPEEKGKGIEQLCLIKKVSEVFRHIIEDEDIDNIIFKIDVEGAEYDIMEDLAANYPEIFSKIEILIGDTHLGFERFFNSLPSDKFHIVKTNPSDNGCCSFEIIRKPQ